MCGVTQDGFHDSVNVTAQKPYRVAILKLGHVEDNAARRNQTFHSFNISQDALFDNFTEGSIS